MKCTRRKDATKMCAEGLEAKSGWKKSYFCPRPDSEPEVICQVARWYWEMYHSHEVPLPGRDSFETISRLNMSYYPMLKEAYDKYKEEGNVFHSQMANEEGQTLGDGLFHMAICENNLLEIKNFGFDRKKPVLPHEQHYRQWAFPAFCGDFRGNETRSFMSAIGAGIGSNPYQNLDFGHEKLSGQLWRDRIPRVCFSACFLGITANLL